MLKIIFILADAPGIQLGIQPGIAVGQGFLQLFLRHLHLFHHLRLEILEGFRIQVSGIALRNHLHIGVKLTDCQGAGDPAHFLLQLLDRPRLVDVQHPVLEGVPDHLAQLVPQPGQLLILIRIKS